MPAEWEPHEATWIAWPHNRDDWPGKFEPVPWVYAEIVRHLSRVEMVRIVVSGRRMEERAANYLDRAGVNPDRVKFFRARTDRVWLRDSGPTFVIRDGEPPAGDHDGRGGPERSVGLVHWKFNAWAKYDDYKHDEKLPRRIGKDLALHRWTPRVQIDGKKHRVVLEGGAIDVNGKGTLLTTEECLLSEVQCRNPGLGREDIERVLYDYLGVRHVIWLGRGIDGDDTHGHVDDLARFVDEHTVVTVVEPRTDDPNHEPLADNVRRLEAARDQDGQPLRVVTLPMPEPLYFEGQRLPASYANFYVANKLVLVPTFNDAADRIALDTLAGLFPGREIVGIHAVDLVLGLGTLHCLSQQQPKAPDDRA
jgi:agmatine deiminase